MSEERSILDGPSFDGFVVSSRPGREEETEAFHPGAQSPASPRPRHAALAGEQPIVSTADDDTAVTRSRFQPMAPAGEASAVPPAAGDEATTVLRAPSGGAAEPVRPFDSAVGRDISSPVRPFASAEGGEPSATGRPSGEPSTAGRPPGESSIAGQPSREPSAADWPPGESSAADWPSGESSAASRPSGESSIAGRPSGEPSAADWPPGEFSVANRPSGEPSAAVRPFADGGDGGGASVVGDEATNRLRAQTVSDSEATVNFGFGGGTLTPAEAAERRAAFARGEAERRAIAQSELDRLAAERAAPGGNPPGTGAPSELDRLAVERATQDGNPSGTDVPGAGAQDGPGGDGAQDTDATRRIDVQPRRDSPSASPWAEPPRERS
ncbi:hypothetical protein [Dactylosporangium sp. CA-233914]|uniref:hypothetical protein n=1 Tax=Dactylosporangium sp. CA-233914 TaxID=3239934 RepID=UPI003D8A7204